MSVSPLAPGGSSSAGSQLHAFIRQGRSFSGRERNCAFLNLRGQGYVDVSSLSGFDCPDDGRAIGRVDWDHDGDLDLWVANRSGPQVRFLKNDVPTSSHWIAVRLIGRSGNRDAIGARATLVRSAPNSRPLTRTLRAGDGFLAQSSKWLHFGLGTDAQFAGLDVRWPAGELEHFRGLAADGHYVLEQGTGEARPWKRPGAPVELKPSQLPTSPTTGRLRVVSSARLPLPSLSYTTFGGETRTVLTQPTPESPRPVTLIVLWASWCSPCVAELREIANRADELRQKNLAVVALSVESAAGDEEASGNAAATLIETLRFPFAAGRAHESTIERLRLVNDRLFDLRLPLPVPVSFLVDREGTLVAIYRGAAKLDQIIADAETAAISNAARSRETLPFAGRWLRKPGRLSPIAVVWELLEKEPVEGIRYLQEHRALLDTHVEFPRLAVLAGNAALALRRAGEAIAFYRDALKVDSDFVDAQNNLAWILATHTDDALRDGQEAIRLAAAALRTTDGQVTSVWDTLGAAYAEARQWDRAVGFVRQGLEHARQRGEGELETRMARRLDLYQQERPYRAE